jgi:hypothetical protein
MSAHPRQCGAQRLILDSAGHLGGTRLCHGAGLGRCGGRAPGKARRLLGESAGACGLGHLQPVDGAVAIILVDPLDDARTQMFDLGCPGALGAHHQGGAKTLGPGIADLDRHTQARQTLADHLGPAHQHFGFGEAMSGRRLAKTLARRFTGAAKAAPAPGFWPGF